MTPADLTPSDVISLISEALGEKDEEGEPETLLKLLLRDDLPKQTKLIILNCIVKNCGLQKGLSILDPFVPLDEIESIETSKIDGTKVLTCINYTKVKDCYMIILANRQFRIKRVTNPGELLQKMKQQGGVKKQAKDIILSKLSGEDL
ncbi:MAG: hypothetical protein JHC23_00950 [Sulfolobus sp.]|nr:hypothetical protein [Sulfolobus sp.]